jgi:hypothetical protein
MAVTKSVVVQFTSVPYPFTKQQLLTTANAEKQQQQQSLRSNTHAVGGMGNKEAIAFVLDASLTMNAPLDMGVNEQKQTRLSLAKSIVSDTIASYIRRDHQTTNNTNIDCIIVVVGTKDTYHHLQLREVNVETDNTNDEEEDEDEVGTEHDSCENESSESETETTTVVHHDVFPNVTEINGCRKHENDNMEHDNNRRMMRPNVEMLRHLSEVQVTSAAETETTEAVKIKADFCDGLIVAADSLHRQMSNSNDSNESENESTSRRLLILTDACSPVHSLDASTDVTE